MARRRRPAARPPPAPAPVGGAVRLTAIKPVWFDVSERSGATLFTGTLDQGKSYDVPPTAVDPVIRTGKPEGLVGHRRRPAGGAARRAGGAYRRRQPQGGRVARPRVRGVAVAAAAEAGHERAGAASHRRAETRRRPTRRGLARRKRDNATPSAFRAADGNAAAPQPQP